MPGDNFTSLILRDRWRVQNLVRGLIMGNPRSWACRGMGWGLLRTFAAGPATCLCSFRVRNWLIGGWLKINPEVFDEIMNHLPADRMPTGRPSSSTTEGAGTPCCMPNRCPDRVFRATVIGRRSSPLGSARPAPALPQHASRDRARKSSISARPRSRAGNWRSPAHEFNWRRRVGIGAPCGGLGPAATPNPPDVAREPTDRGRGEEGRTAWNDVPDS